MVFHLVPKDGLEACGYTFKGRALDKREYLVIFRNNFFLSLHLHKNICYDPSSEPSRRDGSDEGSHHMVSMRNKKNYHQILPLI